MLNSGQYNFSNKDSIKSILLSHGYPVSEGSNYINTAGLWRGGSDPKSIAIYYQDDKCVDFVDSSKFSIKTLISLVTNQKDDKSLQEYLSKNNIVIETNNVPVIKQQRIFSDAILNELIPSYDYWISRGISEEVLRETKGGIYTLKGSLKGRFVIPIFNSKLQIVGLAARDVLTKKEDYKWLLKGQKTNWCYNALLNGKDIKEKKSVFLLESWGDYASLMTAGIRNCLVLFGTELNLSIINYLLKLNISHIYISTNEDSREDNNMAGNRAAEKIFKRLNKYFSYNQLKIVHPKKCGDWNEVLQKFGKQEILEQLKEYIN